MFGGEGPNWQRPENNRGFRGGGPQGRGGPRFARPGGFGGQGFGGFESPQGNNFGGPGGFGRPNGQRGFGRPDGQRGFGRPNGPRPGGFAGPDAGNDGPGEFESQNEAFGGGPSGPGGFRGKDGSGFGGRNGAQSSNSQSEGFGGPRFGQRGGSRSGSRDNSKGPDEDSDSSRGESSRGGFRRSHDSSEGSSSNFGRGRGGGGGGGNRFGNSRDDQSSKRSRYTGTGANTEVLKPRTPGTGSGWGKSADVELPSILKDVLARNASLSNSTSKPSDEEPPVAPAASASKRPSSPTTKLASKPSNSSERPTGSGPSNNLPPRPGQQKFPSRQDASPNTPPFRPGSQNVEKNDSGPSEKQTFRPGARDAGPNNLPFRSGPQNFDQEESGSNNTRPGPQNFANRRAGGPNNPSFRSGPNNPPFRPPNQNFSQRPDAPPFRPGQQNFSHPGPGNPPFRPRPPNFQHHDAGPGNPPFRPRPPNFNHQDGGPGNPPFRPRPPNFNHQDGGPGNPPFRHGPPNFPMRHDAPFRPQAPNNSRPPVPLLSLQTQPPPSADEIDDDATVRKKVEEAVTPLCQTSIDEQLEHKTTLTHSVLEAMRQEICNANPAANTWFLYQENKFNAILDLQEIIPSPLTEGYRNKCEFVIGINPADNHQLTIGFLIQRGTSLVGPVDHLKHVPDQMKFIVRELQRCLRDSQIPAFDLASGKGNWMGVTIRLTGSGEVLLVIAFHPQNMNNLQVRDIKSKLARFFTNGPGVHCCISSLYFNERKQWESGNFELLNGNPFITEMLLGKQFQINPKCFFSINTAANERLNMTIAKLVHLNRGCTLLDVCCGTGAIGLSLADQCGQVLGIDILDEAIDDARLNALANNITNCEFFPGSAEEHLGNLFKRIAFSEVICVIDPPRGGLGSKAINHIRRNDSISKVVFVASDPYSAMKTFVDLSRAPSNTFRGEPFIPIRAVPVDTLPHTNNFSLLFLLLRVTMSDLVNPQNVNPDSYKPGCVPSGDSTYPEPQPYGQGAPAPDLSWQKVLPQAEGVGPELAGLSKEQVEWLDQMTQMYGTQFERNKWIETFRQQNMEASLAVTAAAGAGSVGADGTATVPEAGDDNSKAWAAYSKQYREYKEWWEKHGANYASYSNSNPGPGQQGPSLEGDNSEAWKMYNAQMSTYWSTWNGQQPQGQAPPLPSTPAPK